MNATRVLAAVTAMSLCSTVALAQSRAGGPRVEFETMTWPEVKQALADGKTTALIYTGGTEQRGPQNANGGHNLMAKATVKAIALKLGNAIAMPVLPYTPNNASAALPGTLGLTNELLAAILERLGQQAIVNGFKNVILMGDHGGGQGNGAGNVYRKVATKLDSAYAPKGIHVFYADSVYAPRQAAFDKWLEEHGYPRSSHGGIPDTSEMMYLDTDGTWVRKELVPTANGDPVGGGGRGRGAAPDPNAPPRLNNGISGDARRSTAELGKMVVDMKVEYAVRQINRMVGTGKP